MGGEQTTREAPSNISYSYFRPALLGLLKQMAEKGPDVDVGESFRPTRPRYHLREKGDGGGHWAGRAPWHALASRTVEP